MSRSPRRRRTKPVQVPVRIRDTSSGDVIRSMLNQPVKNAGLRFAVHLALPVIMISKPQIRVELPPETAFWLLIAFGAALFGVSFVERFRRS